MSHLVAIISQRQKKYLIDAEKNGELWQDYPLN
jgi:hypothetical protein